MIFCEVIKCVILRYTEPARSLVERMAYKLMGVLRSNAYKVLGKHTKCWEKAKGNLVTWARVGENDTKVVMISKMNTQDQMRLSVN